MNYCRTFFILLGLMLWLVGPVQAQDCERATDLVLKAYDDGKAGMVAAEQIRLLRQALELCPRHVKAHNNLGAILEGQEDYEAALEHYRAAARIQPDFTAAWLGIGDVYAKTGQFPLSLDAYLSACAGPEIKAKIEDLLESERYAVTEAGEILNKESLLLLFDDRRRETFQQRLSACGFKARLQPEFIFRNIEFKLGEAALKPESLPQLKQLNSALQEQSGKRIIIHGHTDKTWFKDVTDEAENERLNLRLSQNRAATVEEYLLNAGIPGSKIEIHGYGWHQPIVPKDTDERNRRVEIEVR